MLNGSFIINAHGAGDLGHHSSMQTYGVVMCLVSLTAHGVVSAQVRSPEPMHVAMWVRKKPRCCFLHLVVRLCTKVEEKEHPYKPDKWWVSISRILNFTIVDF